jgi:hypothetical protein
MTRTKHHVLSFKDVGQEIPVVGEDLAGFEFSKTCIHQTLHVVHILCIHAGKVSNI